MLPGCSNRYAVWRNASRAGWGLLREGVDVAPPPERLLQTIWQHQRVRRGDLRTRDGRAVRVLHPGFRNREPGPDFQGAIVQFGEEPPVSGDVEVDLVSRGWRDHGHDTNSHYRRVILHVVWQGAAVSGTPPTLLLAPVLDTPLAELAAQLGAGDPEAGDARLTGRCRAPLQELTTARRQEILRQAALVRLESKGLQLAARARESGWEQALWTGLFMALGYKHNTWPMRRLAEWIPELRSRCGNSAFEWQARLLGLSGLLPAQLPVHNASSRTHARKLWEIWWRERDAWETRVLPRAAWRLAGIRPANHPHRRLALAANWQARPDFVESLERWFLDLEQQSDPPGDLLARLRAGDDEYWQEHWTLDSPVLPRPQPLIGAARVTDLAINVILPWFWMRAVTGHNAGLRERAERQYFAWPKGEDNAVLKLARQRLLGPGPARELQTAGLQQGLIQIVRDFCDQSNALCEQCRFPDLVRDFDDQAPAG